MSKIRSNPLFPGKLPELANALGQYWRELADFVNNYHHRERTWDAPQRGAYVTQTSSSASIAIDLGKSNNFKHTLTEATTLAAPTNATAGQAGVIEFKQHASAPKTLAFNAFWKWPGGTDGVLTATNSAVDVMSYVVSADATFATCVMLGDVK